MFEEVVLVVGSLVGFSMLVSIIVNVLKFFNVVKDDTAATWVAGFNLVGVLALYAAMKLIPDFNVMPIDSALQEVAIIATYIFSFVVMLFGSKLTHMKLKGLPLIGFSNSPGEKTKLFEE